MSQELSLYADVGYPKNLEDIPSLAHIKAITAQNSANDAPLTAGQLKPIRLNSKPSTVTYSEAYNQIVFKCFILKDTKNINEHPSGTAEAPMGSSSPACTGDLQEKNGVMIASGAPTIFVLMNNFSSFPLRTLNQLPRPVSSNGKFVRAAPLPQHPEAPRWGISCLFAKLSFMTAPGPFSLFDEDSSKDLRGFPRKKFAERSLPSRYVEANSRYLRLSPIKTRRVVQELRGKTLAGALAHLASSPRRPALAIFRTIESAVANAVHLHGEVNLKPQLVSVTANNGPVMKRPFFKARGRLNLWRRPTTHIKVILRVL
ncbi:uncharacterized protein LOC113146507 [Cyclospora cayetanensis]|uniref:Uncharacterized protein LOC113146507 n=1 Tax=Cyclospora cayetanensis TaxID=88456 RepID=A0A6P6RRU1_9EIME|nr:uncharacterized protein LOC113146507 [Cyclospora cayetanensis]